MAPGQKALVKNDTAESFVGSIFKFSISAIVSLVIYAAAIFASNFFVPNLSIKGEIEQFLNITNAIMTLTIFGLDQSYIRFCNEPPGKLNSKGLFRLCLYLSATTLAVAGVVCSLFFMGPLHSLLKFHFLGPQVIPLLFINAFFYMIARYFYVLYRMEANILLYTVTSILLSFVFKLFYLTGAFFENQLPAMVLFSMSGLGALAFFCILSRIRVLRPRTADWDKKALASILPYGFAVAPTAVMVVINNSFTTVYVAGQMDGVARGIYTVGNQLSNIITAVQLGFAAFWSAYMYANYKTQQARIKRVHDYLNLLILVFFALVVAFEDILFFVLQTFKPVQPIFPMMMLSAVFAVLCETTVYGNTIARRPIFDTIGNGLAFAGNVLFCILLIPHFGLLGAAFALAAANFLMFFFRTLTAQRFYSSIASPAKTTFAVLVAITVGFMGTWLQDRFLPKLLVCSVAILVYCLLYQKELKKFWSVALAILKNIFKGKKT